MAKKNPLAQGLERTAAGQTSAPPSQPVQAQAAPTAKRPPSRTDRVLIGGFFAPEVQRALKIAAAEESTTIQALLTEAIDSIFAARGKPQIAGLSVGKGS